MAGELDDKVVEVTEKVDVEAALGWRGELVVVEHTGKGGGNFPPEDLENNRV